MAANLDFIKQVEITSDNTTNIDVTNCFDDRYNMYKIFFNIREVGAEVAIEFRLIDSGGNVISDSEYDHAYRFLTSTNSNSDGSTTGADKWQFFMYGEEAVGGFAVMDIYNPYDSNLYTFAHWDMTSHYLASSTATQMARHGIGVHKVKESITGFRIYGGSANIDKALASVYGVRE